MMLLKDLSKPIGQLQAASSATHRQRLEEASVGRLWQQRAYLVLNHPTLSDPRIIGVSADLGAVRSMSSTNTPRSVELGFLVLGNLSCEPVHAIG
ncbi:hypothetical protein D3C84_676370 [compost metagenome]